MASCLPSYCDAEFGEASQLVQPADTVKPDSALPCSSRARCCSRARLFTLQRSSAVEPASQAPLRSSPSLADSVADFLARAHPSLLSVSEPDASLPPEELIAQRLPVPDGSKPLLPALPAKLLLWNILHTRYVSQVSHTAFRVSTTVSLCFALLPIFFRVVGHAYISGGFLSDGRWKREPQTIIVLVIYAVTNFLVSAAVIMYLLIGEFCCLYHDPSCPHDMQRYCTHSQE
jgi:hypothetical protein